MLTEIPTQSHGHWQRFPAELEWFTYRGCGTPSIYKYAQRICQGLHPAGVYLVINHKMVQPLLNYDLTLLLWLQFEGIQSTNWVPMPGMLRPIMCNSGFLFDAVTDILGWSLLYNGSWSSKLIGDCDWCELKVTIPLHTSSCCIPISLGCSNSWSAEVISSLLASCWLLITITVNHYPLRLNNS